jgi:hypothetical protein
MLLTLASTIKNLPEPDRSLAIDAFRQLIYVKNAKVDELREPIVGTNANQFQELYDSTLRTIDRLVTEIENINQLLIKIQ